MPTLLTIIVLGIVTAVILPKLKTKVSQMESQLTPEDQKMVKRLDKPLKTIIKISSIITIAIIAIPLIFIVYLLAMFFLIPR